MWALGMGTASAGSITAATEQVRAGAGDVLESRAASPVLVVGLRKYPPLLSRRH